MCLVSGVVVSKSSNASLISIEAGLTSSLPIVLISTGVIMFLLICTTGYLPWYYESVSLEFVDGSAKLVKEYGPLHVTYTIYVILYFIAMIFVIIQSVIRKKNKSKKYAILMTSVVFGNLLVWFVEKYIPVNFEFLSVSYLMSEFVFLSVGWMLEDYVFVKKVSQTSVKGMSSLNDITNISKSDQIKILLTRVSEDKSLTSREYEILICILDNKKRKEIAEELSVSENTVKTHMSHLYEKLNVSSRDEIWKLLHK